MKQTCLVLVALLVAPVSFAGEPVAVSPGEPDRISLVEVRCPTFSWGFVPEADHYVVSVIAVDTTPGSSAEAPVLEPGVVSTAITETT